MAQNQNGSPIIDHTKTTSLCDRMTHDTIVKSKQAFYKRKLSVTSEAAHVCNDSPCQNTHHDCTLVQLVLVDGCAELDIMVFQVMS